MSPDSREDKRLDTLMRVLMELHECGVITDPAVSSTKESYGLRVEVEFLLDFKPEFDDVLEPQTEG